MHEKMRDSRAEARDMDVTSIIEQLLHRNETLADVAIR